MLQQTASGFFSSATAANAKRQLWLNRNASLGDSIAMYELGRKCEQNGAVGAALAWYKRSADAGNPSAMYRIGFICEPYNQRVASFYYQSAADAGNLDAMQRIGDSYSQQFEGQPPSVYYDPNNPNNYERTAGVYYERVINTAKSYCLYKEFGVMYKNIKDGVIPAAATEMVWYENAAGDSNVMYNIGNLYLTGVSAVCRGLPKYVAAGELWMRRAAAAGNEEAEKYFGRQEEVRRQEALRH